MVISIYVFSWGFAPDPHQGSAPGPHWGTSYVLSPRFVPLRNKFLATPLIKRVVLCRMPTWLHVGEWQLLQSGQWKSKLGRSWAAMSIGTPRCSSTDHRQRRWTNSRCWDAWFYEPSVTVLCFVHSMTSSVSQKNPPEVFWHFLPNCWDFLVQILYAYCMFLCTLDCKFLFNYL